MNTKNHKKKKKNPTHNQKSEQPKKKPSQELPPVTVTVQEATLIYELMHDVKLTYMTLTEEEKSTKQVKDMISLCDSIMKKVETLVITARPKKASPS
tara:strand:+ start:1592 stop:1882 length:291 start_codon:yes stop_codon:yes gene_type:complete